MKNLLFFFFILFSYSSVFATVKLPDVFSDNMVLQQNSQIKLWGTAKPRSWVKIKASWTKKGHKVHAGKDGKWKFSIKTDSASFEPQTITFNDGRKTTISNILIGEVWFCSGQSNMVMNFKGFKNQPIYGAEEIVNSANPENGIRMLKVKTNIPEQPLENGEGEWRLSTSRNVQYFSAAAYYFALSLREELNVPIGIINSSYGGSTVEGWMNRELVATYPDVDVNEVIADSVIWRKPYVMYNGMLKPYTKYVVKGFVWYQGEGSIDRYKTYAQKQEDLAKLWRSEWNLGEIPFLVVEIAPYLYDHPNHSAKLREAQFIGTSQIPNSGFVGTNDLVAESEAMYVHPSMKGPIGERLANLALMNTYGFDTIQALSPSMDSVVIIDSTIVVHFKDCYDGLLKQSEIIGFEIAGEDHVFYTATGILTEDKTSIILNSVDVLSPIAVRYCFKNYLVGNVKNSSGLPLIGFRNDEWED
jgi:sialate O-acetylesterase